MRNLNYIHLCIHLMNINTLSILHRLPSCVSDFGEQAKLIAFAAQQALHLR